MTHIPARRKGAGITDAPPATGGDQHPIPRRCSWTSYFAMYWPMMVAALVIVGLVVALIVVVVVLERR